jgi:hypothetical protein
LSLPIARSAESAVEREASSREGRLADTSVPELLARAYRVSFSGSLLLEPADGAPSTVRFVGGAVVDAAGPAKTTELEWEVLSRLLPSDTLEFATQHAQQYGVTPFSAVERLVLLPPESLVSARQAQTALEVQALCSLSGDVRYAFVAPSEGDSAEPSGIAVEPLGLLASCFLVESQLERAARSVAPFEYAALHAEGERARKLLPTLNGAVRAVLEVLVRSAGGVQSLRERNLVPNAELVAAVCALWITREITVRTSDAVPTGPASTAPPRSMTPPPRSMTPSSRPSVTPFVQASSMLPPRKNSGFIRAQRDEPAQDSSDAGAKEYAMELKVEEAWMRAEADPGRAQQISGIVNKAIAVFPKNPRLHYYLARLHIQANRIEEAVKELERVIELDPNDTQAESDLADLRARLG